MAEEKPTKGILRKGKRAEKSGQQHVRFSLPPKEQGHVGQSQIDVASGMNASRGRILREQLLDLRSSVEVAEASYMEDQDFENFEMIETSQEEKQIKGILKPERAERNDRLSVRFDPSEEQETQPGHLDASVTSGGENELRVGLYPDRDMSAGNRVNMLCNYGNGNSLLERLRYGAVYGITDEIIQEHRRQFRNRLALMQSGKHYGSVREGAVELAGEVVQLAPNGDPHEDMTNKEDKEDEQVEEKSADASGEIETDVARVYQEDSLEVKKILKKLMFRDYELMFETYDYEDVAEEDQPCFKHLGAVWRKCARSKTPVLV